MTDSKTPPFIELPHLRRYWPTMLVTLLTLIGLSIVWQLLQQRREQNLRDIFTHESHRITTKIGERVSAYGQILRSGAGLFAASEKVDRVEWEAFVEKLELDQSYRGIQGVGFSLYIPKQNLAAHLSDMRKQGFPDYVVKPEGDREDYTSIIYLEPFTGRNLRAFGYDMYSEATRNTAMAQARDVGDVIFSGKVKLVQETKADVQAGLLAYFPVYRNAALTQTVEQRRASLVGWVYSPYRMNDLMTPILAKELDEVRLQIFDSEEVSDAHLLYDSEQGTAVDAVAGGNGFTVTEKLELSGRYWTLRYAALPGFAATKRFSSAWVDLATLMLIGMLVLGLSGALVSTRRRAEAMQLSEARLRAIIENEPECIKIVDAQGRLKQMNPAGLAMIEAESEGQVLDRPVVDLIAPEHRTAFAAMHQRVIAGEHVQMEFKMQRLKGGYLWLETHAVPMQENGETVHLAVTRDITERHRAEVERAALLEEIRQLAYFDALTGLPNRRLLSDRLSQTMASSKRSNLFGALMFLDLDNFKPLNDAHGHSVGDLLLIEVAKRLSACVREMDTVARLGGDEFVVMIGELDTDKGQSAEQAANVAEKIRASLAAPYLLTVAQPGEQEKLIEHHCSVSIGVVLFFDHEASQNDLMKWADAAMYQAKDAGRNGVQFYHSPIGNL